MNVKAALVFFLLVPQAMAQQAKVPLTFYQACFGGVDNYRDSARIDDCDFQDGRNFLTDRGYLEKRPGSLRVIDTVNDGFPVQYGKEFITQSNVKTLILHSGTTVYATDFSSAPVAITTVNVNGTIDSVSAFNRHFFVTGYDTPFYYDGASVVQVSSIPTCTFIEFAYERLWCANATGAESTLYASAFGDYTDWTIPDPLPADAPNSFTFDRQDGKPLTGLFYSPYGILAFKRTKMFVLRGVDNDDFTKQRISDSIGCVDDRSIQLVDGRVTWLGEDGVYQWAGGIGAPELISRDIDTTIRSVRNITSNPDSQIISSLTDFQAGLPSTNGSMLAWDTARFPGSITPSTWTYLDTLTDMYTQENLVRVSTQIVQGHVQLNASSTTGVTLDDFSDGDYTSSPAWTVSNPSNMALTAASGFFSATSQIGGTNILRLTYQYPQHAAMPYGYWGMATKLSLGRLSSGLSVLHDQNVEVSTQTWAIWRTHFDGTSTVYVNYNTKTITAWTGAWDTDWHTLAIVTKPDGTDFLYDNLLVHTTTFAVTKSSETIIMLTNVTQEPIGQNVSIDTVTIPLQFSTGTFISPIIDTTFLTPTGGPFEFTDLVPIGSTLTYSVRSSTYNATAGMGAWTVVSTGTSGGYAVPATNRYWQYAADFSTSYSTQTPALTGVTLHAASTGTWDSAVLSIGTDITSWGQFAANVDATRANNLFFYMRSSSTLFAQDDTSIAWTLQANGENVSCSTGAFAQVRVVSNLVSSTESAKVNSITINWQEGEASKVASLFHDKRYFLAVNTSTSTTVNNLVLVRQRSGKWTMFDGPYHASLWMYDLNPYAGDGLTTSKVWRIMYEDAWYDDNVNPINAYVVTKDFQFGGQNNNKVFRHLYLESSATADQTLSLGYSVDKAAAYQYTSQAVTGNTVFNDEIKGMFPGFAKGRYLRLRFGNAVVNEPLKLDGYTVLGDIEGLYRR